MANRSIDELITEKALDSYQDTLRDLMDVKSWTPETRDEKFEQIQEITNEICRISVQHTEELMRKELNGNSVLYWKLREQFVTSQLEFLKTLLDELHSFNEEEMKDLPVDYDWVIAHIRSLTSTLESESKDTEKFVQASITTSTADVVEI